MYKLYVIPGSHACRSAMLMLEHKRIPYRRVDVLTLTHPVVVRLHGFDAGGRTPRIPPLQARGRPARDLPEAPGQGLRLRAGEGARDPCRAAADPGPHR